jgi:uncharacterized protein (DUF427 family)
LCGQGRKDVNCRTVLDEHKGELSESATRTTYAWKGRASYYTLDVNGKVNEDAAWYYPNPKEAAEQIKGYGAFWKG